MVTIFFNNTALQLSQHFLITIQQIKERIEDQKTRHYSRSSRNPALAAIRTRNDRTRGNLNGIYIVLQSVTMSARDVP